MPPVLLPNSLDAALAILAGAYEAALQLPRPAALTSLPLSSVLPGQDALDSSTRAPAGTQPSEAGPARASTAGETPAPPCRPQPLRLAETSYAGPRRYVGTVGGERATAELDWRQTACTGAFTCGAAGGSTGFPKRGVTACGCWYSARPVTQCRTERGEGGG